MKPTGYALVLFLLFAYFFSAPSSDTLTYAPPDTAEETSTPVSSEQGSFNPLDDTSDPGNKNYVAMLRADATSDFELRVLEDGVVTQEEYDEAVDLYAACVADQGLTLRVTDNPFVPGMNNYEIDLAPPATGTPTDEEFEAEFTRVDELTRKCADGTTMRIEALYHQQITNPDGEDISTIVLRCFEETGVIEPGSMTRDELAMQIFGPEGVEAANTGDMQAYACLENPAQTGLEDGLPDLEIDPFSTPIETND